MSRDLHVTWEMTEAAFLIPLGLCGSCMSSRQEWLKAISWQTERRKARDREYSKCLLLHRGSQTPREIGLKDSKRKKPTLSRFGKEFLYSWTLKCKQHGWSSPVRKRTPLALVPGVDLTVATSMSFSSISRLHSHNGREEDDLRCTNEEVGHGADEGGCPRTHRKPVTEAGNWTQTISSSWVPSPSSVADRSPLLLGLWNLSLVGFLMNAFFFHLSSHYVSFHSHFCFVEAFYSVSFLF